VEDTIASAGLSSPSLVFSNITQTTAPQYTPHAAHRTPLDLRLTYLPCDHARLLSQSQRRKELPSRHLPFRFACSCRIMQHLPDHVFQKLQQQREGQAGQESGEPRSRGERSGRRSTGSPTSTEAPLALTAADLAHARLPPSPPATLLGETIRSLPPQAEPNEASRRRPRAFFDWQQSSPSRAFPERDRLGSGPRAPTPSPWPPTAETVPSQLLGGGVGSDADVLTSKESPESVTSTIEYHAAQKESTAEHLRTLLSPQSPSRYALLLWTDVAYADEGSVRV